MINELIALCGHELHDMLRGVTKPRDTLARLQRGAEKIMQDQKA